jgi:uncharacterized membrane protein
MDMIELILWIHVFAGAITLITGLIVFIAKKGGSLHRKIGRYYYFAMTIVFITSIYVSLLKDNIFLLLVGFFSYYLVYTGIKYHKTRVVHATSPNDYIRVIFFSLCFLAMLVIAAIAILKTNYALGIVLLVFGSIGSRLAYLDIQFFLLKKKREKENSWMKDHIGRMTGSYIAAFTAFAVNNIHFLPTLAIWLFPTVLGTMVIIYYNRKYKLN